MNKRIRLSGGKCSCCEWLGTLSPATGGSGQKRLHETGLNVEVDGSNQASGERDKGCSTAPCAAGLGSFRSTVCTY